MSMLLWAYGSQGKGGHTHSLLNASTCTIVSFFRKLSPRPTRMTLSLIVACVRQGLEMRPLCVDVLYTTMGWA